MTTLAIQGDDAGSEVNEIKFETIEQSALCVVSDMPHMKEERKDISSILGSSLQSVKDGIYIGSQVAVGKAEEISMGQAVVSCLQTIDPGNEGANTVLDPLGIVIEEVHITEEVQWEQQEVPFHSQPEHMPFNQLCRVCALETEKLVSVFGEEGTELQLVGKIHWHLPIEVREDDKLPVTVCASCISKLNSCHELAISCLKANEKLCKLFNVHETNLTDFGEKSNFAAAHLKINRTLDISDKTRLSRENLEPSVVATQRTSKRPTLPGHQLSKAMELLKKAKEECGKNVKSTQRTRNDDQKTDMLPDNMVAEMEQSGGNHYADSGDVKINSVMSYDSVTQDNEESNPTHPLPSGIETNAYGRPQRQIKKISRDCNIFLKPKMVGVVQGIIRKEDDSEDEGKERKRSIRHKEWRCEICGHVLLRKTALITHQQRKHGPQNFSCSYCDKTFRNAIAMKVHERSHTKVAAERMEPTLYMCEFCGKSFRGKKTLKEHHLANHSDDKPYKCDKCDRNYGSLASLDIHKATHSTETPYLCDLCGKSFKHVSNLRSHKRSHMDDSDKNRQVCDVCGKGFRSRFHLSEHMNVHTGRRPYACNVCGKHFHKKIQLRQHGSAHSGTQPFKCHLCGVRFNRRGNMTQHIKRHDRIRKYTCRVCNEGFATLGAVLSHRKKHTKEEVENSIRQQTGTADDPEQVAYKCEVCGKLLAKKESLAIHTRSHTGEKPFECGVCGKKLSNKGSLSYHMRSFHTGERPHTCQYCGEGFLSREARLVHERIHTGEKPYICSVCGMGFRCSSNLAQHSRVHSEARPHPCPHCEKRFQRKGALDVHMRTHTGERPYACDLCGRRFTQKNDMLKHRRTHSPDRPCTCPQCGQVFSQKRELAKHQLLHIATSQTAVQHVIDHSPPTQTVLITTADGLITYPEINVPVMENAQTLILHRY